LQQYKNHEGCRIAHGWLQVMEQRFAARFLVAWIEVL